MSRRGLEQGGKKDSFDVGMFVMRNYPHSLLLLIAHLAKESVIHLGTMQNYSRLNASIGTENPVLAEILNRVFSRIPDTHLGAAFQAGYMAIGLLVFGYPFLRHYSSLGVEFLQEIRRRPLPGTMINRTSDGPAWMDGSDED